FRAGQDFRRQREAVCRDRLTVRGEAGPAIGERVKGEDQLPGARSWRCLSRWLARSSENQEGLVQESFLGLGLRFSRGLLIAELILGRTPVLFRFRLQGGAPLLVFDQQAPPVGTLFRRQALQAVAALELPEHPRPGVARH